MARGGKRPGAGRKTGATNKMTKKAREEASLTGELPHERLLKISRGEPVYHHRKVVEKGLDGKETVKYVEELHYPSFKEQSDAASAAAPYFAPKLVAQKVDVSGKMQMENMSDEELKQTFMNLISDLDDETFKILCEVLK